MSSTPKNMSTTHKFMSTTLKNMSSTYKFMSSTLKNMSSAHNFKSLKNFFMSKVTFLGNLILRS